MFSFLLLNHHWVHILHMSYPSSLFSCKCACVEACFMFTHCNLCACYSYQCFLSFFVMEPMWWPSITQFSRIWWLKKLERKKVKHPYICLATYLNYVYIESKQSFNFLFQILTIFFQNSLYLQPKKFTKFTTMFNFAPRKG